MNEKFKITFKSKSSEDIVIFAAYGDTLLDKAVSNGVAIDAPCSGNGNCGKCKIKLVSGELESPQTRHITNEEYASGVRLACQSKIVGDVVVEVPETAMAYRKGIRTADLSSKAEIEIFETVKAEVKKAGIEFKNAYSLITLNLNAPDSGDTMPDNERLCRALSEKTGVENIKLVYGVIKKLPDILRESGFCVSLTVIKEAESLVVLDISPADKVNAVYAIAVDIGTTTVSTVLVDLLSGEIKAKGSCGNAQIRFGADVIHRIVRQCEDNGVLQMQKAVIDETLNPLISTMCASSGIESESIIKAVIAGNTTMEHFFMGINADYLRQEPFIPAFFKLDAINAKDVGLKIAPDAEIEFAPNVGSYVGGDITAGTLVSMLWKSDKTELFIDLGTNGEIVLGNKDFHMSCACSAGPAFEGGDISCGMRATDGAVEGIKINKETLEPTLETIGGVKPIGLCGSGIIDIIGELFRIGAIDGKGKFIRSGERITEDNYGLKSYTFVYAKDSGENKDVSLTEVDIDNFIRAKAALFSAVMMLCSMLGISVSDVAKIQIAGGIGSGIGVDNAVKIGMLPDVDRSKYAYIGNSSLTGAYCMLCSDEAKEKVNEIASNMTYVELSSENKYMEEFVAACFIPHTRLELFPSNYSDNLDKPC